MIKGYIYAVDICPLGVVREFKDFLKREITKILLHEWIHAAINALFGINVEIYIILQINSDSVMSGGFSRHKIDGKFLWREILADFFHLIFDLVASLGRCEWWYVKDLILSYQEFRKQFREFELWHDQNPSIQDLVINYFERQEYYESYNFRLFEYEINTKH